MIREEIEAYGLSSRAVDFMMDVQPRDWRDYEHYKGILTGVVLEGEFEIAIKCLADRLGL
jgi:hypothetical protein